MASSTFAMLLLMAAHFRRPPSRSRTRTLWAGMYTRRRRSLFSSQARTTPENPIMFVTASESMAWRCVCSCRVMETTSSSHYVFVYKKYWKYLERDDRAGEHALVIVVLSSFLELRAKYYGYGLNHRFDKFEL